jgi:hypothetical protein
MARYLFSVGTREIGRALSGRVVHAWLLGVFVWTILACCVAADARAEVAAAQFFLSPNKAQVKVGEQVEFTLLGQSSVGLSGLLVDDEQGVTLDGLVRNGVVGRGGALAVWDGGLLSINLFCDACPTGSAIELAVFTFTAGAASTGRFSLNGTFDEYHAEGADGELTRPFQAAGSVLILSDGVGVGVPLPGTVSLFVLGTVCLSASWRARREMRRVPIRIGRRGASR